jgi:hypothetical protein
MKRPKSARTTRRTNRRTTVEPWGDDKVEGPQKTDRGGVKDRSENKTGTHAINR